MLTEIFKHVESLLFHMINGAMLYASGNISSVKDETATLRVYPDMLFTILAFISMFFISPYQIQSAIVDKCTTK